MKKLALMNLILLLTSAAFADGVTCPAGYVWQYDTCGAPNYVCIEQALNSAYSSDHYESFTPSQIDQIMADAQAQGHDVALNASKSCNLGQ